MNKVTSKEKAYPKRCCICRTHLNDEIPFCDDCIITFDVTNPAKGINE